MPHEVCTLSNGLRVIYEPHKSEVLYLGYVVCAGTRHEEPADAGMAHFIEHLTFKGTEKRRACHITNGLERVGGDLNAFTTKQETVFYATVLKKDFLRAADLLTDIVFHSTFPQAEIDKEVEVICDEIDSYQDSPSELIFDEFEAMMYPSQPLGRDILGRAADKSGAMIAVEEIPDQDPGIQDKRMQAGGVLPTLNKKLVVNSLQVIFDLLQKCRNKALTTEVSNCLIQVIYVLFRQIYSADPRNPKAMFSVDGYLYQAAAFSWAMSAFASSISLAASCRACCWALVTIASRVSAASLSI